MSRSDVEEIPENGVSNRMLFITFVVSAIALFLTMPNIYLDNQIYYESRKIAQLHKVKTILEEEQLLVKSHLQEIHSKENLR